MAKRYANGKENIHIVTDQLANMYHCPDCGFEYNAQHTQDDKEGGYICPLCEAVELEEKVKRYEKALKEIRNIPWEDVQNAPKIAFEVLKK